MKIRLLLFAATLLASLSLAAFSPKVDRMASQYKQQVQQLEEQLFHQSDVSSAFREAHGAVKVLVEQTRSLCGSLTEEDWDDEEFQDDIQDQLSHMQTEVNHVRSALERVNQGMTFEIALGAQQVDDNLSKLDDLFEQTCQPGYEEDFDWRDVDPMGGTHQHGSPAQDDDGDDWGDDDEDDDDGFDDDDSWGDDDDDDDGYNYQAPRKPKRVKKAKKDNWHGRAWNDVAEQINQNGW